ncbi:Uu.00g013260.m01.CDS01 [Anthostomella pinea]|uniref:Uu.00g013260.m01.CDS01 n=1 Tax=Anthostomella pinea TaxID=933095 RepID=A0AAI8VY43_9PEZI|nr:Uu.00g013260.m01.CDS01 [Anthostomella pinea]
MTLEVPPGTPDRGPGLVALCVFLIVLVTVATTARVASKFIVKQYWWWDDFFALLALPIQLTLLGMILSWREIGLGLHADVVAAQDPLLLIESGRRLYIAVFFFDSSISFPKLSAICFYARIFPSHNKAFRYNLWFVGSLVTGWIVSAIFSTIFQCTPIAKAWNPTLPGHCIDDFAWYLSTAAISVIVDFYILLLPVPMIWALNTTLRRRVYLLGAFFLTYSVIVISLGRMVSTIELIPTVTDDLTWRFPLYLYWACLEGSISLVSISAPNIIGLVKALARPASKRTRIGDKGSNNSYDSKFARSAASGRGSVAVPGRPAALHDDRDGFERLVDNHNVWDTTVKAQSHEVSRHGSGTAIPLDSIHVQTQISVVDDGHSRTHGYAV